MSALEMIDGMNLHPDIAEKLDACHLAKCALEETQARVQANCQHTLVAEKPWDSIGNAVRVCLACRCEEEGSHWSGGATWSRQEFDGHPVLGNKSGRLVLTPQQAGVPFSNSFWWLRIPFIGRVLARMPAAEGVAAKGSA